jgi:L-threonylcarbamoyladenylate synthase
MIYLRQGITRIVKSVPYQIIMYCSITPEIQYQIDRGIGLLKKGGVIAFPTDTVYGLGASISIPDAIEKVFRIKGRAQTKALPLLLSDISQVNQVALDFNDTAKTLANRFWPGPLTLIVFKSVKIPDAITSGGKTVAIRISSHPVALSLIKGFGSPITGTSANLSGRPSVVTAEEVLVQIGDRVDMIIDGGKCPGGIESTIIDVTKKVPVIVREGAIPRDIIGQVCKIA